MTKEVNALHDKLWKKYTDTLGKRVKPARLAAEALKDFARCPDEASMETYRAAKRDLDIIDARLREIDAERRDAGVFSR